MEVDLMRNRHWSPSGAPRSRVLLITVPLVITMAVGLVLGLHFVSQGNASLKLSAQGAGAATATPAATAATGTASATASPAATPSATATAAATATPAAAAANVSCVLVVPANPLTAQGLGTSAGWPARRTS
jgi:type IV secretory pathway TrbL component